MFFLSAECLEGELRNRKLEALRLEVEPTFEKCLLVDFVASACCLADSIFSFGTFFKAFLTICPDSKSIECLTPADCFKWLKNCFS